MFVRLNIHPGALERSPARGGVTPGQHGSSPLGGAATRQEVVQEAGTPGADVGVEAGHGEHPEPVERPLGRPRDLGEHPLQQGAGQSVNTSGAEREKQLSQLS